MNKKEILKFIKEQDCDVIGFSSVDRYSEAPEGHKPGDVLKDAKTVLVVGKRIPYGMLRSPEYGSFILQRSYHTVYPHLDNVTFRLATRLEKAGHLAVPVSSYLPLKFHEAEPWGLLSLRHSAVNAGLGAFGRSSQMYNPEFGGLLRYGALVTDAEFEPNPLLEEHPCPPKCRACIKSCPTEAIHEDYFDKMKCLMHTIRHGIYPLALGDEEGLKHIELIINTAGYNYWMTCHECVRVCPLNKAKK